MRHVNDGWFVVGAACPDVGVVAVVTAVGTLHEYIGFGMQSHAKTWLKRLMKCFIRSGGQNSGELRIGLRGYGATYNSQKATQKPLCQT